MVDLKDAVRSCDRLDIAFAPQINRWRGREQIQLVLEDLRPSDKTT
jgi:hypothetical protein